MREKVVSDCRQILKAYKSGEFGECIMPEDSNSQKFENEEQRLAYFTLPMALNYQRDSYKLWEAALRTFNDKETKVVFDIEKSSKMNIEELKKLLTKHKLALQPNKHTLTWQTLSRTINLKFGSLTALFKEAEYNFLKLRDLIQIKYKKDFPYISGPKIFNYWAFIIQEYGKIKLTNSEFIEIAPDTHVTQCSVKLGVIKDEEASSLSKENINKKWRELLNGTEINPMDMHSPFWFWSRGGFAYKLK